MEEPKVTYLECTDEKLIDLIREGDELAFVFVYDKYWAEMYACAFHLFPNRETCEDLIHDVFLSIWSSRKTLNIKSIRDYLYIAVKNRSLNKIRSSKASFSPIENELETLIEARLSDESLKVKEINAVFEEVLMRLPSKCKEVLILSRKEHLSNKEIASRLNITTKTVENHISNALKRMRIVMGELLSIIFFIFFRG